MGNLSQEGKGFANEVAFKLVLKEEIGLLEQEHSRQRKQYVQRN